MRRSRVIPTDGSESRGGSNAYSACPGNLDAGHLIAHEQSERWQRASADNTGAEFRPRSVCVLKRAGLGARVEELKSWPGLLLLSSIRGTPSLAL